MVTKLDFIYGNISGMQPCSGAN